MSNNNFSAGWNDPPMLGYTPSTTKSGGVRDMFSRRVAFPVNSSSGHVTSSAFDNQQQIAPAAYQTFAPNGLLQHGYHLHHNFSQTYLQHSPDNINRSASSPCFSQENQPIPGGGPFQAGQGHVTTVNQHSPHDQSQTTNGHPQVQQKDIVAPVPPLAAVTNDILICNTASYTNADIMGQLNSALSSCAATIQPIAANNVEKRLVVLKSALDSDSLSVTCRDRLCVLIGHLANHRYKEAYDIHSIMMIEHFSEVNPWMVGVKAVIMECLKKK